MAEHYIIDGKEHVYESADEKHHIKKNITLNGTYKAESEPGDVTGYSEVNVNVEGGGSATLITKNITENGTYNASSDQADGYSSVSVAVPVPKSKYFAAHVVTHSTGGFDASIDITMGYVEDNVFVPVSTENVLYSTVQNKDRYFNIFRIDYKGTWHIYANTEVNDGTNDYAENELVAAWDYASTVDFYLYSSVPYIPTLVEKTITANGTYDPANDNADGYSGVSVEVPSVQPTLITKNISENGTYTASSDNADGYSSVVVDVSPGEVEVDDYAIDFTPDTNAGTVTSGGILFTVLTKIKVSKIRVFARSSSVNIYISTSTGTTIAEVLNASVEAEQWNDVALSDPVTLYPDISYIVWYSHTDSTLVKYKRYSTITPNLEYIDVINGRYSQTPNVIPNNNENGVIYGVDLYVESVITGPTLVEKTITANGTYDPSDDNADGYSGVTVNVPVPSTLEITSDLEEYTMVIGASIESSVSLTGLTTDVEAEEVV